LEWTLKQWQDHVTQMEKRMNELEREVYQLKQIRPERIITETTPNTGQAPPRLGMAWTA
jgi:hypothetical protein